MSPTTLDGRKVAGTVENALRERVDALGRPPGLGIVLAGDDPASKVYVRSKTRSADDLGIRHETEEMPDPTEEEVLDVVRDYNARDDVDAILVQLPLPDGVDEERILEAVDPAKDVDGFHPANLGRLVAGRPRTVPCTPRGILHLLDAYGIDVAGMDATIVGRSTIVGRPLALLLSRKGTDATVTVCHSRTADLAAHTRRADLLVSAVGRPGLITAGMVAEGAVVVDVGINRVQDPDAERGYRLVGDVDHEAVGDKVEAITPVPGGVGPMTVAMLMQNTVELAEHRQSTASGP